MVLRILLRSDTRAVTLRHVVGHDGGDFHVVVIQEGCLCSTRGGRNYSLRFTGGDQVARSHQWDLVICFGNGPSKQYFQPCTENHKNSGRPGDRISSQYVVSESDTIDKKG